MSGKPLYLGVDTSNYTTSLALCSDRKILKSVRRLLPVGEKACGLRQSDAVFLHTKALPELAEELFCDTVYHACDLAAVGVSAFPRDAADSYMPCFLAGVSFASAAAFSHGIPLFRFSHQAGHVMAAIASCGTPERFKQDFLSFHVSGGTTEALFVQHTGNPFSFRIVGGTNDANAGQIIDRAGVLINLPFPCGKALDELSQRSQKKLPYGAVKMKGAYFSLSGLQNKVEAYLASGEEPCDCAAFLFGSIARMLTKSVEALRESYGNLPVLFAGGVMSNSLIRAQLGKLADVHFASHELSSDNACGTALLCEKAFENKAYHDPCRS